MFTRYAIYYAPGGAFSRSGAAWLGWDIDTGRNVPHPVIEGHDIAALTQTPRKYGFHGTIKAPFVLADDTDEAGLIAATQDLCVSLKPASLEGLEVAAMGPFLTLVPKGDKSDLTEIAAKVVRSLDVFRAPPSEAELARRRKSNLTPEQDENLVRWGYPHVMDHFRFHMTLTGRVPRGVIRDVKPLAEAYFAETLPAPFVIDALTLVGERSDGQCVTIQRIPLG
ncbi:MAG: DUF1045 domain-containing protein [Sulfitobacter sp.]